MSSWLFSHCYRCFQKAHLCNWRHRLELSWLKKKKPYGYNVKSAPYLSTTCINISTIPIPRRTQEQTYIKINWIKLIKVSTEFKYWIFQYFSIKIQQCNWEFIPLINNWGTEWYCIWFESCMDWFEFLVWVGFMALIRNFFMMGWNGSVLTVGLN